MLKLNEDPRVHGVYLHLPPACLTSRVLNTIKPEKDVDGYENKMHEPSSAAHFVVLTVEL